MSALNDSSLPSNQILNKESVTGSTLPKSFYLKLNHTIHVKNQNMVSTKIVCESNVFRIGEFSKPLNREIEEHKR